ncbi:MAG: GNAT family N-acetyltransferase [Lachnospiraceae bacterium]|nr:GNAT family N-acetyltransferase [Lachnospiraceae bacterium]
MNIKILRATELWQQTGAYSVRIQGMGRQHHISLRDEFDEHDNADTKYIVLLDDEYPIATCRWYELDNSSVMIGRLVVLPEYRGYKLGLKVMQEAEEWIKEAGYKKLVLESREEVIGFYEKLGYTADYNRRIHGVTFDCVYMEKLI